MNKIVEQIVPAPSEEATRRGARSDFSYFVPGIGRFRTNLFQQRGQWCLAMRYVKTQVPSFEELGLLAQVKKSPNRRAASCWWPGQPVAANRRRWRR